MQQNIIIILVSDRDKIKQTFIKMKEIPDSDLLNQIKDIEQEQISLIQDQLMHMQLQPQQQQNQVISKNYIQEYFTKEIIQKITNIHQLNKKLKQIKKYKQINIKSINIKEQYKKTKLIINKRIQRLKQINQEKKYRKLFDQELITFKNNLKEQLIQEIIQEKKLEEISNNIAINQNQAYKLTKLQKNENYLENNIWIQQVAILNQLYFDTKSIRFILYIKNTCDYDILDANILLRYNNSQKKIKQFQVRQIKSNEFKHIEIDFEQINFLFNKDKISIQINYAQQTIVCMMDYQINDVIEKFLYCDSNNIFKKEQYLLEMFDYNNNLMIKRKKIIKFVYKHKSRNLEELVNLFIKNFIEKQV